MKSYLHAKVHAKKYGGIPDDYVDIDDFIDSSKQCVPDVRHRAILHSSFGCFIVEQIFGRTRVNSAGKTYSPRDVAEDHIQQDNFIIPTVEQYLKNIKEMRFYDIKEVDVLEHCEIDLRDFGIPIDASMKIHRFMESSFDAFPDIRHNAILHNGFGLSIVRKLFGDYLEYDGKRYDPFEISKRHITREFTFVPSLYDFLSKMEVQEWMSGTLKHNRKRLKIVD